MAGEGDSTLYLTRFHVIPLAPSSPYSLLSLSLAFMPLHLSPNSLSATQISFLVSGSVLRSPLSVTPSLPKLSLCPLDGFLNGAGLTPALPHFSHSSFPDEKLRGRGGGGGGRQTVIWMLLLQASSKAFVCPITRDSQRLKGSSSPLLHGNSLAISLSLD